MDATVRPGESFQDTVLRLRATYNEMRDRSNLFACSEFVLTDVRDEMINGQRVDSFWCEVAAGAEDAPVSRAAAATTTAAAATPPFRFFRLYDIPGTLSGDILRLKRNLPAPGILPAGHFEIAGDTVRALADDEVRALPVYDDDSEDTTDLLARLPEVAFDPARHFAKRARYRSEITNHLLCQGGSCANEPASPHLMRLLGKSTRDDGAVLVFPKRLPRYLVLPRPDVVAVAVYRRWLLHLVDGLRALHGLGIVHRDLRFDNILFTEDGQTLLIGDLEGRWGLRVAPEIQRTEVLEGAGWTPQSDIYDIGPLLQYIIYANSPVSSQVEWPVPAPFQRIVDACTQKDPRHRPSLDELQRMVEEISE